MSQYVLDQELSPLADFLGSPLLHNFPYHLFGISPSQVVELMTRQPAEASALVSALLGIAEQYNIGVEHFYRAALRSYQELNENYFPEIENAVDEFTRDANIKSDPTPSYADLRMMIVGRFGYSIDDRRLSERPQLRHFRTVLVTRKKTPPTLLMDPALNELQKKFVLAREIGYQAMGIKERAMTSAPERVDSFEQVLNVSRPHTSLVRLLINVNACLPTSRSFSRWTAGSRNASRLPG